MLYFMQHSHLLINNILYGLALNSFKYGMLRSKKDIHQVTTTAKAILENIFLYYSGAKEQSDLRGDD